MLIFKTHFLRIIINNTTMRLFVITLAALLGMATHMKAQSFTQHIQQHTKDTGTVTVVQSKDIDELVNSADVSGHKQVNPAKTANPSSPSKQTSPSATTTTHPNSHSNHAAANNEHKHGNDAGANNKKEEHSARENNNSTASGKQETETDIPTVDMRKKIPLRSYKVNGYRVQVFAGGNSRNDRVKAQKAGSDVKMAYPDIPVYVHFYSPRWICRMGNFRTYEEASAVLKGVKKLGYKQACIVSGKITVAY